MKKTIIRLVTLAFVFCLLCACELQPAGETPSETAPTVESTAPTVPSQWKAAYLDYLESQKDTYLYFALVYIDDDEIPELYLSGNCEAVGDAVCSYQNGTIHTVYLNRIGGGRYAERTGVIINQNGNMGHVYTHVYQLTKDGFILTFTALSAERIQDVGNEEYFLSYDYSIDDTPVSEEDYLAAVNAAFPFTQSRQLDEAAIPYDAIRQTLLDTEHPTEPAP